MRNETGSLESEILETISRDMEESERIFRAQISGRPPGLLMHNIEAMMKQLDASSVRRRNQKPTYEEEAEAAAYKMEDGTLYIPSKAIYGCIVHAGRGLKFGKFSAKSILATVRVFPEQISLGTKEYEINVQSAVVNNSRIPRARPLVREWKAQFYVVLDSHFLKPEDLRTVIHDAGKRVGILDFRPEHLGQYGQFRLDEFEEVEL